MKNPASIAVVIVEIVGAIAECAIALLDGKPETRPDLNRMLSRILAALAGLKGE